jgi:LuxR family quorum sensing-dependent transcriptional regulator
LWLCRGKTIWEIAKMLGISQPTVKYFFASARTKFGVLTTKEAMVIALMHRIIEP